MVDYNSRTGYNLVQLNMGTMAETYQKQRKPNLDPLRMVKPRITNHTYAWEASEPETTRLATSNAASSTFKFRYKGTAEGIAGAYLKVTLPPLAAEATATPQTGARISNCEPCALIDAAKLDASLASPNVLSGASLFGTLAAARNARFRWLEMRAGQIRHSTSPVTGTSLAICPSDTGAEYYVCNNTEVDTCAQAAWYVRAVGYYMWSTIQLNFSTSVVEILTGDQMFMLNQTHTAPQDRLVEEVFDYLSTESLIAASQERVQLLIPLPFYFARYNKAYLAHMTGNTCFQNFDITCVMRPMQEFMVVSSQYAQVYTASTTPGSGTLRTPTVNDITVTMLWNVIYLPREMQSAYIAPQNSVALQWYDTFHLQVQQVSQSATASANPQSTNSALTVVSLTNKTETIRGLIFFIRRKCNEDGGRPFNFSGIDGRPPLVSLALKLSGQPYQGKNKLADNAFDSLPEMFWRIHSFQQAGLYPPSNHTYGIFPCTGLQHEVGVDPMVLDLSKQDSCELEIVTQPDLGITTQGAVDPVFIHLYTIELNLLKSTNGATVAVYQINAPEM